MITNSKKELELTKLLRKKALMTFLASFITCSIVGLCYSNVLAAPTESSNSGDSSGSTAVDAIENIGETVFMIVKAIGVILAGWGVVQVGMSFGSHDAQQRSNGFLFLAGGIIVFFTKEILNGVGITFGS